MKAMTNEIALVSLIAQILAVSGCHPGAVSPGAEMAEYRVQRSIQIDFAAGSTLVVRNTAGTARFKAPPQYQGALALEAWYGSVKFDAPTDVRDTIRREKVRERLDSGRGTIRHEKVTGHIRSGKGNVRLATNLGSVRWR